MKYILNFTPTGMIPTKDMTSFVPISTKEIIEQVNDAAKLGANMIHLHARDPKTGLPTYKKDLYAEMIKGIRNENPDIIICVSLSGRNFNELSKRSEALDISGDLKPDFGSLTLSSLNFNKMESVNSPEMIQNLAKMMLQKEIKPELEAFDLGMINYAKYLIKKNLIKPPYYFNLILGNIACAQADMMHLGLMIKELPDKSIWAAGGIGETQLTMNSMALVAGGGIRIGLEDNIFFDNKRTKLATNEMLIKRILKISDALGLEPYSHLEARDVLGLK